MRRVSRPYSFTFQACVVLLATSFEDEGGVARGCCKTYACCRLVLLHCTVRPAVCWEQVRNHVVHLCGDICFFIFDIRALCTNRRGSLGQSAHGDLICHAANRYKWRCVWCIATHCRYTILADHWPTNMDIHLLSKELDCHDECYHRVGARDPCGLQSRC